MKIRNGFVSNSSSSSFLLAYDKTQVITNPADLVELLKKDPHCKVLMRGWDLGEGDDIFTLSEGQKTLIRKFAKKFIQVNSGLVERTVYSWDEDEDNYTASNAQIPVIEAYPAFEMTEKPYQFGRPEVDMSDIPEIEVTSGDLARGEEPEVAAKIEKANEYYKIQEEREREARKKYTEEAYAELVKRLVKDGIPEENIATKEIDIHANDTCDENLGWANFSERYLSTEGSADEDNSINPSKEEFDTYILVYEKFVEDKEEILKAAEDTSTCNYLCWTNPAFNYDKDDEDVHLDFYEIDTPELRLLKNENFLTTNRDCRLYVNARILRSTATIEASDVNKKIDFFKGNVAIIESGEDLPDFKKNLKQPEEW